MVLPAAVTTVVIGITLGVTFYLLTNLFNSHEEPISFSSSPRHRFVDIEPRRQHTPKKARFDRDQLCSICQERLGDIENNKELNCGHFLHLECYREYELIVRTNINLQYKCPICRKSL